MPTMNVSYGAGAPPGAYPGQSRYLRQSQGMGSDVLYSREYLRRFYPNIDEGYNPYADPNDLHYNPIFDPNSPFYISGAAKAWEQGLPVNKQGSFVTSGGKVVTSPVQRLPRGASMQGGGVWQSLSAQAPGKGAWLVPPGTSPAEARRILAAHANDQMIASDRWERFVSAPHWVTDKNTGKRYWGFEGGVSTAGMSMKDIQSHMATQRTAMTTPAQTTPAVAEPPRPAAKGKYTGTFTEGMPPPTEDIARVPETAYTYMRDFGPPQPGTPNTPGRRRRFA